MGFVDKLFECLSTKNYLGLPAAKEPPKEEVKPAAVKSDIVEVIQKTLYTALLRFLTPSLLFPLQFIFVFFLNVVLFTGWDSRGGAREQTEEKSSEKPRWL